MRGRMTANRHRPSVVSYIARALGDRLVEALAAMEALAAPLTLRRLAAGGKELRTVGPAVKEKPFRRAIWLLFVPNLQDVRARR